MCARVGGNVGIGTANPQAKLHIGGIADTDGIMFPDGSVQTKAATFGSWTSQDSLGNNLALNNVYKVTSDGFLIWTTANQCCPCLHLAIDGANPPNEMTIEHGRGYAGGGEIIVPLKKNYYWKATAGGCGDYTGPHYFRWIPIGNGVAEKQ